MKRLFFLVALGMASCASLESPTRGRLVGEWRYRDEVQACRYSFHADGTFSGDVTQNGRLVSKFTGQWRVENNRLFYVYRSDALGRIPAGATDQDQLLAVDPSAFVIQAADGSRRRYQRTQ